MTAKTPLEDCWTEKSIITIVAIGGLVILESVAMATGHDGAMFLPVVAAVAGLGGFGIGEYTTLKKVVGGK